MAPRIERLFDHTVRVWRPTVTKDTLGAETRTYQPVGELGCKVNRSSAPEADIGAGLAPVGSRRLYMKPGVDVQPRDIIELVSGPDAPGTWEVDQPPTQPRGHHTQVDTILWHGNLPPAES